MLAQNFKSAADLKIPEEYKDALAKTLVLLETGKLRHVQTHELPTPNRHVPFQERQFSGDFNMADWSFAHTCGTACCIGGTAELIGGIAFDDEKVPGDLHELFYPSKAKRPYSSITPEHAARALRSYLTTGDPRWDLAVS